MKSIALFLFLACSVGMAGLSFGGASSASPKTVVAGPESTVYGIAYEHGILTRTLIAANNLKPPYILKPGQQLIIPSPNEHFAGQGETLQSIAEEHGVNVDVLAQENEAQSVRPGERLLIPSRDTESMAAALKPPADNISTSSLAPLPTVPSKNSSAMADKTRVVPTPPSQRASKNLPSELAEEIAREKGVKYEGNGVDSPSSQPMLMGNLTQRNAGAPTAATTMVREEEPEEAPKKEIKKADKKKEQVSEKKNVVKAEEKIKEKKPAPPIEETQAKIEEPSFVWPVDGKVISEFKPGKNNGFKIKTAKQGMAVKAAAAGVVHYAGNELAEFGNLVLLKHEGGWVTAYGHNSSLLIKKGDKVKQGQVIAKSGIIGDTNEPQLHFELRKGKEPIAILVKKGDQVNQGQSIEK